MGIYLIAWESPEDVIRPAVVERIQKFEHVRLCEYTYVIDSECPTQQLYDLLAAEIGRDEDLYVIPLSGPFAGCGPRWLITWLRNRLVR